MLYVCGFHLDIWQFAEHAGAGELYNTRLSYESPHWAED